MAISDEDLLALVAEEARGSVGWDNDPELTAAREQALNYVKGRMPDVVAPPNRSQAVSTDIADAVETILPDLVEIFTGGDDVAVFIPRGQEDEAAAQQETDYVNHVIFNENDGWLALYSMFKDALVVRTGLVTWWWEDEAAEEEVAGVSALALAALEAGGAEVLDQRPAERQDGSPLGLWDARVRRRGGRLRLKAIAPDDFTVAPDTVSLKDATYCAFRSRPRAQELIELGVDPEVVEALPAASGHGDAVNQARDHAAESALPGGAAGGQGPLRQVEVRAHWIRVFEGDLGRTCLYRVLTDAEQKRLIDREEVEGVQVAAITPYLVPHRFYGESVADHLAEIQKIKTVLTRGHLDSMYFALNQRLEVAMSQANEFTISDLLRNEPGIPIRVATPGALRPVQAGGPGFDALASLEYYSTVGEQRSGVVRAAQGLKPDTLHETAKGALALLTAAQKRTRLIARVFAETGLKDLYLGVHALLRRHDTRAATVRLRGQWTAVDPTGWGRRQDMSIEIGLGASGREHDLMVLEKELLLAEKVLQLQGGAAGPLMTLQNLYALIRRFYEKLGCKTPDLYVSDPSAAPPAPPRPDPGMAALQGQLRIEQAKQGLAQYRTGRELELKRYEIDQELAIKRAQLSAELALKRELALGAAVSPPGPPQPAEVHPGGAPG